MPSRIKDIVHSFPMTILCVGMAVIFGILYFGVPTLKIFRFICMVVIFLSIVAAVYNASEEHEVWEIVRTKF